MTPWEAIFGEVELGHDAVAIAPSDFEYDRAEIISAAKRFGFSQVASDMPDEVLFVRVH